MKANSFSLEAQLSAISRCIDKDLIALGGINQLKIYSISPENEFKQFKILKVSKSNKHIGTKDVSWNPKDSNILASTTLINSQILLWDVEKTNLNFMSLKLGSHDQLINRISWNQIKPNLLASCSQDKYLKIWDKNNAVSNRENKESINPKPVILIESKEKIRDCQFSPIVEHYLLTSCLNGNIKVWDTRMYKTSVLSFIQHSSDVLTVDWHPTQSNIFCSGGMDRNLFIWNINNNSPILSYKTSQGTSRVKWFQYNPQYIITSYQMNNIYTSMWNINIPNIPEYKYPGHKDVVTGFCWDLSQTRLITCSKDGKVMVNYFKDGLRSFDNISTSVVKFSQCDELMNYHDTKPPRKSFDEIDISHLCPLNNTYPALYIRYNNNNKHISDDIEKKGVIEEMNFNQTDFTIKRNPTQSNRRVKLNNAFWLNYTTKLQQYYKLDRNQIEHVFKNYHFILEGTNKDSFLKIYPELTYSEKLQRAISYNLEIAKESVRNYNHFSIWNELNFLASQQSFKSLDEHPCRQQNNSLYVHIIKSNVLQIVDYLIDVHNDLYLATIISYLFHPILEKEGRTRHRLLRMEIDCWDYLKRLKLFVLANKLKKFGLNELQKHQNDPIIVMTCGCGICYDGTKTSQCSSCKKKVNCSCCFGLTKGLYIWCSGCGHGGHPEHIEKWFKTNKNCPFNGCKHDCVINQ